VVQQVHASEQSEGVTKENARKRVAADGGSFFRGQIIAGDLVIKRRGMNRGGMNANAAGRLPACLTGLILDGSGGQHPVASDRADLDRSLHFCRCGE